MNAEVYAHVYVDGQTIPIAKFQYSDHAAKWAKDNYPGKSMVRLVCFVQGKEYVLENTPIISPIIKPETCE